MEDKIKTRIKELEKILTDSQNYAAQLRQTLEKVNADIIGCATSIRELNAFVETKEETEKTQ